MRRQIKLQRLQKVSIWAVESLVHQINSSKRFLNRKNSPKSQVVTGLTPL